MPDRLQEIRARLDAATPGEAWNIPNVDYTDADVDLIINASDDIAWLLGWIDHLTQELNRIDQ